MRNVRGVDLNLLVVFDALVTERSVTKAGERIGLAQPSMSNALTRLRALFDDELFVRTPEGMMPTPIAVEAAEHVRTAILAAEDAINISTVFDPKSADGEISLLTNDFIELTIVPRIFAALERQAPGIRLKTRALLREEFAYELDAGLADFALGGAKILPKRFCHTILFDEGFAGIARRGHPILNERITLEAYLSYNHVLATQDLEIRGIVDDALASMNLSRRVSVVVSNFASVPPLVAKSDLIAVLPRRLAMIADRELPVSMFELPLKVPTVEAKLIWGRGVDRSPMFTWFRGLVKDTVAKK